MPPRSRPAPLRSFGDGRVPGARRCRLRLGRHRSSTAAYSTPSASTTPRRPATRSSPSARRWWCRRRSIVCRLPGEAPAARANRRHQGSRRREAAARAPRLRSQAGRVLREELRRSDAPRRRSVSMRRRPAGPLPQVGADGDQEVERRRRDRGPVAFDLARTVASCCAAARGNGRGNAHILIQNPKKSVAGLGAATYIRRGGTGAAAFALRSRRKHS